MNTFFLIFVVLPALEIFLMIKIGGEIGALNTVSLIFITAVVGVYYARLQGIRTLHSGLKNIYQNKTPVYEILSGASIALAALLLIIPGFFSDTIGFLLLIPFTRKLFFKFIFKNKIIINIEFLNLLVSSWYSVELNDTSDIEKISYCQVYNIFPEYKEYLKDKIEYTEIKLKNIDEYKKLL